MVKNQEKVLAALMLSGTQAQAAEKAGISDRTLRGYMADSDFKAAYQQMKNQLIDDATRELQLSYHDAIRVVRNILMSDFSSGNEKISAARTLLEYGTKFTVIDDVTSQIEELKQTVKPV